MLSYRHGFHAGNHADLLKHLTLVLVLQKLCEKSKPFSYLDTHAGAGLYDLDSEEASKTKESEDGVIKFMQAKGTLNSHLDSYLTLLRPFVEQRRYPGSPAIANSLMREQDNIQLVELHSSEVSHLSSHFHKQTKVSVHHRDGFEGLVALTPPQPARGLALIDPSYELIDDYSKVIKSVETSLRKWATGIFLIWYPLLSERPDKLAANNKVGQSERMLKALSALPSGNMLTAEFIAEDTAKGGMYGSGMAIINAPWQLDIKLGAALRELSSLLSATDYSMQWLRQPS